MGNYSSKVFKRLFDYPIKEKPICFVRQEDYSSTGEPVETGDDDKEAMTQYDNLCNAFFSRLLVERRQSKLLREKDYETAIKSLLETFPGWNEMTMTHLQGIFHLFDKKHSGLIDFKEFCSLVESFGDDSTKDARRVAFEQTDSDMDGQINYNEFLSVIYNYDPPDEEGNIQGLALKCRTIAEDINFVSKLTVGEQIEYGLF
ncbi:hypothetical protein LSTR_LSTR001436 [Laodelphax striatellus]|uniref:EF-hand domain-containing protein n=1 Tax=Laodelphax striatellus TaxID=195883 RepID=A0A482XBG2_LAOST|nr:hypothetical protein LSTR_LSTR001436 [Laodelphax striatellus]